MNYYGRAWITPSGEALEFDGRTHGDALVDFYDKVIEEAPPVKHLIDKIIDYINADDYDSTVDIYMDAIEILFKAGWIRVTDDNGPDTITFEVGRWDRKTKHEIQDYLVKILKRGYKSTIVYIEFGRQLKVNAVPVKEVLASDLLEVSVRNRFSSVVSSLVEKGDEPRRKTATKTKIPPAKPVKDRPRTPEIVFDVPDDNAKMAKVANKKIDPKNVTSRVVSAPPERIKGPAADARAEFMRHGRSMATLLNDQDLIDSLMDEDEEDLLAAGFTATEVETLMNAMDTEVPVVPGGEIPQPVEPQNLPAVIEREMIYTGGRAHPKWYQVKRLPGYMQQVIRLIGRKVFKSFTYTPIEEVHVLSTLTNTESELQLTASWIQKNGNKVVHQKLEFQDLIPDYEADMEVWDVAGYQFALVKDFMGLYIYGWVSKTGKHWDPRKRKYIN